MKTLILTNESAHSLILLLIAQMVRMGLPEIIDRQLPYTGLFLQKYKLFRIVEKKTFFYNR
ncbi:MAG TPA: hypothetical protein VJ879_05900 [Desulfobacter sp.]|nr:hypothetical protein [Desulfobacter sp.]